MRRGAAIRARFSVCPRRIARSCYASASSTKVLARRGAVYAMRHGACGAAHDMAARFFRDMSPTPAAVPVLLPPLPFERRECAFKVQ